MADKVFRIEELRRDGDRAEKFQWIAAGKPEGSTNLFDATTATPAGGTDNYLAARAAPLQPWTMSGAMRTVRTDYPGAKTPSEQVLGPNHEPFTLRGRWDDRYNFADFAVDTMRRFEAMCRRGNLVKISFEQQSFICLITGWKFDYRRNWYIPYEFTVSVHDRPDDFNRVNFVPPRLKTTAEVLDRMDSLASILANAGENIPGAAMASTKLGDIGAFLETIYGAIDTVAATLDNVNKSVSGFTEGVINPFKQIATQLRTVAGAAFDLVDSLVAFRSDIDLVTQTAGLVYNYEDSIRSLKFFGRIMMGEALEAAQELEERADPDAKRIYRPFQGESLYAISRRFYGTPHAWKFIADRNGLTDFELTGDELLIIPERGEG